MKLVTLELDSDPHVRSFWNQLTERYGSVPSLLRVVANSPSALQSWVSFVSTLRDESGGSTSRLQEMVIMRSSAQSANAYEFERHSRTALLGGLCSDEEIQRLCEDLDPAQWEPVEAGLLRVTDRIVAGERLRPSELEDLEGHLTPDALVRCVLLAAFYVAVDRIVKSLDVQLLHDTTL